MFVYISILDCWDILPEYLFLFVMCVTLFQSRVGTHIHVSFVLIYNGAVNWRLTTHILSSQLQATELGHKLKAYYAISYVSNVYQMLPRHAILFLYSIKYNRVYFCKQDWLMKYKKVFILSMRRFDTDNSTLIKQLWQLVIDSVVNYILYIYICLYVKY